MMPARLRRVALCLVAALALAGCAGRDLSQPAPQFGDMALGYAIVVAKNAQPVGPSRKASAEEWEAAIRDAVQARVGRQQGEKLYHLGIGVDGYALAVPGIPVVLSPKSALVASVTLWDDAAQVKVNAEPRRFTVLEALSPETVISSGLTQSRETQVANLSAALARAIEGWLAENPDWFTPEAAAGRAFRAQALADPAAAAGLAGLVPATTAAPAAMPAAALRPPPRPAPGP